MQRQSDPRSNLLALVEHGNPYLFLSCVGDYLQVAPHDDQVRAQALRLYTKIGFFSVAEELALACPPSSPVFSQLQEVASRLAVQGKDRVDWSQTDGRFAANLQALRGRSEQDATLAGLIEHAWQHEMPPDIALHLAADGNWQVRCCRSDGQRIWLPSLQDYSGTTEAIANEEAFRGNFVSPFLLDGVGIGCLVPRLWKVTLHTYLTYSAAIYIVEPNVRALALALRLHDWSQALADERLIVHAGASAWNDWLRQMEAEPELPEPSQIVSLVRWPGDCTYPAAEYVDRLKQYRRANYQQERTRAEEIYAGRDVQWWAGRYASADASKPIRVLCLTSRHTTFLQHSARDLVAALQRAGLPTQLAIEQRDHTALAASVLMRKFAEFQPDLVVVIDHHRWEMPERFISNVPFFCWIQDELPKLYSREAGSSMGPLDFTMGFGKDTCVSQYGYPAERFMPCPMVVDSEKFAPELSRPDVDPALQCDVAYTGHHAETPQALHERVRSQVDPPVVALMDAFYEEMLPLMRSERFNGAYDLGRMLGEVEAHTRIDIADADSRSSLIGTYVRPLADRVMRHTTLEWVADWAEATGHTLRLYGRGWEQHPRFSKFACGVARHGSHLGAIMRSAAINLHFGMNLALHQRVLETSVAGGFLMVRHHPQDFYPKWMPELWQYVHGKNMTGPARIPYGELPPDLAQAHRERLEAVGRPIKNCIEISERFLENNDPLLAQERRRRFAGEIFPMLGRITFNGPESFRAQAEHFLAHPDERADIVRHMQAIVQCEYTYDALVKSMKAFLRERLLQSGAR